MNLYGASMAKLAMEKTVTAKSAVLDLLNCSFQALDQAMATR
jgi:hypothetical protein